SSGGHSITAAYGGNSSFAASTSAALTQTVNKATTNTSITAHTPNPSVAGQPVTVTFTVTPVAPGAGTPTGNVTVSDGAGDTCTATIALGGCSMVIAAAGTKTLTAIYAGDSNFNSSASATLTHNVTDFSISASAISQSVKAGQKTSYKATLAPLNVFTGTVSLSCTGLPSSSTCSFSPTSINLAGSSSVNSTVTVQTSKTTPKGTYSLKFTGIYGTGTPATGGLTHSANVTLTVQ